jgi:acyl-CoA synthetase (AMP-forming)/AMP-acid ligase II
MLIDVLRAAEAEVPDRPFVITPGRVLTYADAVQRSEALARGLKARGIDRFGVVVTDVAEAILLVCASTAIGSEACVYPNALADDAIAEYAAAFDHGVVISDRAELEGSTVVPFHALATADGELPATPEHAPTLILTTGTTGRPKGARHDWSRLAPPRRADVGGPETRWLLAYNLNQFAGIQVVLQALTSHSTLVVPQSNQPRAALAAMRDHSVTHASGTPTFWRFLCALLDADAAGELALRQITLGGEAVPEPLLATLRSLFPGARLSQVYASTEFGSTVSVRDGRHGLPISVLERGEDADVQFRIVDGELHARSRIGMLGYHGQDEVDDTWRPTGDLVEVRDGRIEFVGRTSEVINVGGVKVHPLPVEELVSRVAGVQLVHAYGRANPISGQIVVVDVVAQPGSDLEQLDDDIRAACASLPAAARPRRVKFVDGIEVNENKIVRRANSANS